MAAIRRSAMNLPPTRKYDTRKVWRLPPLKPGIQERQTLSEVELTSANDCGGSGMPKKTFPRKSFENQ